MKNPEDVELTSAFLRLTLVSGQDGDVGTAPDANGPLRIDPPDLRHSRCAFGATNEQPPAGSRALACSLCAARIASRRRRHGTNPPPDKDHCRGSTSPCPHGTRHCTVIRSHCLCIGGSNRMRYSQVLSYCVADAFRSRRSDAGPDRSLSSLFAGMVMRVQFFNVTLAILRHQKEVKCGWGRPDHQQAFAVRRFQRRRRVVRFGDVSLIQYPAEPP